MNDPRCDCVLSGADVLCPAGLLAGGQLPAAFRLKLAWRDGGPRLSWAPPYGTWRCFQPVPAARAPALDGVLAALLAGDPAMWWGVTAQELEALAAWLLPPELVAAIQAVGGVPLLVVETEEAAARLPVGCLLVAGRRLDELTRLLFAPRPTHVPVARAGLLRRRDWLERVPVGAWPERQGVMAVDPAADWLVRIADTPGDDDVARQVVHDVMRLVEDGAPPADAAWAARLRHCRYCPVCPPAHLGWLGVVADPRLPPPAGEPHPVAADVAVVYTGCRVPLEPESVGPVIAEYDPIEDCFLARGPVRGREREAVLGGLEVETDLRGRVQGVRVHGAALGRSPAWKRAVRAVLGPELDDVRQDLAQDALSQLRAWTVALVGSRADRADEDEEDDNDNDIDVGAVVGLDCLLLQADALAPLQSVVEGGWPQEQPVPGACPAWVVTSPFLARPGEGSSRWAFPVSRPLARWVGVHDVGMAEMTASGDCWAHLRPVPGRRTHTCRATLLQPVERAGVLVKQAGLWSYRWPRLLDEDEIGLVVTLFLESLPP